MTDDNNDPAVELEHEMLRRHIELEELRKIRLEARVAGRTDEVVFWVESPEEEEDEATLDAFGQFRPTNWWED